MELLLDNGFCSFNKDWNGRSVGVIGGRKLAKEAHNGFAGCGGTRDGVLCHKTKKRTHTTHVCACTHAQMQFKCEY